MHAFICRSIYNRLITAKNISIILLFSGADVRTFSKPPGERFTISDIEAALVQHKPAILFLVHGESSTGVVQELEGIGALCLK